MLPSLHGLLFLLFATSSLACSSADFAIAQPEPDSSVTPSEDAMEGDTSIVRDSSVEDDTLVTNDTSTPPPDAIVGETITVDGSCACPAVSECQTASCVGTMCITANKTAGHPCTGGKCNGSGKCVQCTMASDCPGSAPICNSLGKCVQCVSASQCPAPSVECKMAVCNAGVCGVAPKPRDTLCNGLMDQCDGAGNCVDCTTSGGCGECCVCSTSNTCVPA